MMNLNLNFVRVYVLLCADILVVCALFVMQKYFTDVWKLSLTHAAAIINFWNGIYRILPLFLLYLADSFLGNFKVLVFTSISHSAGIVLVFMSLPPILADSTHTCKEYEPQCIGQTQKTLLHTGLALIAVGAAGNLGSRNPFFREQINYSRDTFLHDQLRDKLTFPKVYELLGLIIVLVASVTAKAIPHLKLWTLRFGIPAIFTVLSTLWFLSGSCSYKKESPNEKGSPLSSVCRVFISAAFNIFKPYPGDDNHERYHRTSRTNFSSTSCLKGLHKAAVIEDEDGVSNGRLCSVDEVEDAKIAVRMVPMWMTFVVCGVVSSAGDTYFIEQASKLDRHIGKIKLPIEVLLVARMSMEFLFTPTVERLLRLIRKDTAPSFGIAFGMICSILCCVSAAGTERMRLKVVRRHDLLDRDDEPVAMSIYWLLFQFVLLGSFDSILQTSVNAYYRGQSPDSMKMYLQCFTHAVSGLGFMCGTLSVYVVGRISETGGRPNWFQETLSRSRLDRYYWFLAVLSSVNLVVFVFVASRYRYKNLSVEPEKGPIGPSRGYAEAYEEGDRSACCRC